jgi:diguanylate cyclase (GGDEF)-like protein
MEARARGRVHTRWWQLVAAVVLVAGVALSLITAQAWRSSQIQTQRRNFRATATDVTEALEAMLARDSDLVNTLRGVMTMNPRITSAQFRAWYQQLRDSRRDTGGIGTAIVALVPAHTLGAFEVRRDRDPAFEGLVGGSIAPITIGSERRYCLLQTGAHMASFSGAIAAAVQQDWCSPGTPIGVEQSPVLAAAASSGGLMVVPLYVAALHLHVTFVEIAYYRRGWPLRSAAQRRAALAGWLVSSFDIDALLRIAAGANRGQALALYQTNPGAPRMLVASRGHVSTGSLSERTTVPLGGGAITIVVRGTPALGEASADLQGALILGAGGLVSILLSLLLLALSRSREDALAMVAQTTGQLRHQALHDTLTGLPNRVLALDRTEQLLARARRSHVPIAVLSIDIDGFKHINDSFGHAVGDRLMEMVAGRLSTVVRESDTAARLAGDEFVVLLEGSTLDAGPELVAERVLDVLREPYNLIDEIGRELTIGASIGVAYGQRESAEMLLDDADIALRAAKENGRNGFVLYESGMQTAAHDRVTLEMDLADALQRDELRLLYQPTVDLRTERPTGVEALLRWHHPERGLVGPDVFIPIAETSGLIVEIGRWVLGQACRQVAGWHEQGFPVSIAVNVSGRQLDHDRLIGDVRDALRDAELDPSWLTLEITETTLMRDPEATARRLAALKDLGVRIAIDDFGTGYSSLAYLRQFPVDTLKIDRSFVQSLGSSEESAALIHTLIELGRALALETIGEGIEDRVQLEHLQSAHCDSGQGYLFARPLDPAGLAAFLIAHAESAVPVAP